MSQLTLVYISLSGNTQSFVKRMSDYLSLNHGIECRQINIKELNHETFQVDEPFVALLPTYLEGGNGVDNGDVEILTNPLGDFSWSGSYDLGWILWNQKTRKKLSKGKSP